MDLRLTTLGLAALAAATWLSPASAGTFTISPLRVDLSQGTPAAALTVRNEENVEVVIQVETLQWSQAGGQDVLEPTRDLVGSPLVGVTMSEDLKPVLHTADGEDYPCDVFYPMLGETARSDLAAGLGAVTVECSKLLVDDHLRTSVPGLYAIGDVTRGLNQIAVATGQAAIAATTIHNTLPWALR